MWQKVTTVIRPSRSFPVEAFPSPGVRGRVRVGRYRSIGAAIRLPHSVQEPS
jgi:hypothetical protein